jgi:hypothetical protein
MKRPHISFSEFMLWNECHWRWMRDYLEGRRAPIYSVHLEFGSCVHDALETYKDPDNEDERPAVEQICETFEVKFREKYGKIRDKDKYDLSDEDIDEFVEAGINIIRNIDSCSELAESKVLFVEHKLMEKIDRTDDVDIKFKGFIDIVIKTKDKRGNSVIYICDYKTCSWGWNRKKRDSEELKYQLRLYKHFFSKKFNVKPNLVKTAFILLKRRPKDPSKPIEWLPFPSGNKTTMRAVLKLNEAITGMQTNDYKKNRSACTNKFGDTCPYYGTDLCLDD